MIISGIAGITPDMSVVAPRAWASAMPASRPKPPMAGRLAAYATAKAFTVATMTPPSEENACVYPSTRSRRAASGNSSASHATAATNSTQTRRRPDSAAPAASRSRSQSRRKRRKPIEQNAVGQHAPPPEQVRQIAAQQPRKCRPQTPGYRRGARPTSEIRASPARRRSVRAAPAGRSRAASTARRCRRRTPWPRPRKSPIAARVRRTGAVTIFASGIRIRLRGFVRKIRPGDSSRRFVLRKAARQPKAGACI